MADKIKAKTKLMSNNPLGNGKRIGVDLVNEIEVTKWAIMGVKMCMERAKEVTIASKTMVLTKDEEVKIESLNQQLIMLPKVKEEFEDYLSHLMKL